MCRWCSQASGLQRAGRAGRVAPGTIVHLFTERFYNQCIPAFDDAEILRLPLEKTVLSIKLLLPEFGTATQLLAESLTPPPPQRVSAAISSLYESGALTNSEETAAVTSFGSLAAHMPVDLPLVKLILLGQTFGCLPDAIVMAAALSLQDLFRMPSNLFVREIPQYAEELAANLASRCRFDCGNYSEPLAYLSVYRAWLASNRSVRWARTSEICQSRASHLDMLVANLAEKFIAGPKDRQQTCSKLELLYTYSRKRKACGLDHLQHIFSQNTNLLRFILAGACAPNFLAGTVKSKAKSKKQEGKTATFAFHRTIYLNKISDELNKEKCLEAALKPLGLKVTGFQTLGTGKAVLELCENPTNADFSGLGKLEDSAEPIIKDMSASAKFLLHLSGSYKHKLHLPNPNHCPGSDSSPEVPVGSVTVDSLVTWKLEGKSIAAFTYWRSPLGSISNFDGNSVHAAAMSLLGRDDSSVWAEGVTLFPTAYFSKVLQLLFSTRSDELKLELRKTDGSSDGIESWVVCSYQVGKKIVSFSPMYLKAHDIDHINSIRKIISHSLLVADFSQAVSLQKLQRATSMIENLLLPQLHSIQATPLIKPATSRWIICSNHQSNHYLPEITLALLDSVADQTLEAGDNENPHRVTSTNDSAPKNGSSGSYAQPEHVQGFACKATTSSSVQGQVQGSSYVSQPTVSSCSQAKPPGDPTLYSFTNCLRSLIQKHSTDGVGIDLTELNAVLQKSPDLKTAAQTLKRKGIEGLGQKGTVKKPFFLLQPALFQYKQVGSVGIVSLVAGSAPAQSQLDSVPLQVANSSDKVSLPASTSSSKQEPFQKQAHMQQQQASSLQQQFQIEPSISAPVGEDLLLMRVVTYVRSQGPESGADLTAINQMVFNSSKSPGPDLKKLVQDLRKKGISGLGSKGSVKKAFFLSRPALFHFKRVGTTDVITLAENYASAALIPDQAVAAAHSPETEKTLPASAQYTQHESKIHLPQWQEEIHEVGCSMEKSSASALPVCEKVLLTHILVYVQGQGPHIGVEITAINQMICDSSKSAGPDLKQLVQALHKKGISGLGKKGSVKKDFFLSRSMFKCKTAGAKTLVYAVEADRSGGTLSSKTAPSALSESRQTSKPGAAMNQEAQQQEHQEQARTLQEKAALQQQERLLRQEALRAHIQHQQQEAPQQVRSRARQQYRQLEWVWRDRARGGFE